ncbi:MAG: hypothetical protein JWQ97_823, partial [Phenylobacterium sp.]|nr:hypothetical protein [Phenylobacterium sp.]
MQDDNPNTLDVLEPPAETPAPEEFDAAPEAAEEPS